MPDADRLRSAGGRVTGAFGTLWSLFMSLLTLPLRGGGLLTRQLRGTWSSMQSAWDYLTFDNILPPSIVGTIQWLIETIPKLLGIRDTRPWQQVGAAISVIGVALLATVLSGGTLIATVVIVAGFGLIGLIRFVPAANNTWNAATEALPIKNDYDVARWKRD